MKTRSVCLMFTLAIGAALSVSSAMAQPGGGGFGGRGFGGGFQTDPSTLLAQETVQKEVELSGEQKTQITAMGEETQKKMGEIFQSGGEPQENFKKMAEVTAANKKKLAEILHPPQTARLDEIVLQYAISQGAPGALTQDANAEKLAITADQKEKLTKMTQDGFAKLGEIAQDAGGDRQAMREKMTKFREEQKTEAMALLTAEQKEKLEKLQGKKFDVSTIQIRFGGQRRNQ